MLWAETARSQPGRPKSCAPSFPTREGVRLPPDARDAPGRHRFWAAGKRDVRSTPHGSVCGSSHGTRRPDSANELVDAIGQQVQLVAIGGRCGVDRDFGRRQFEDQPANASVDTRQADDLAQERAILLRVVL